MNPAAPVTRMRIGASLVMPLVMLLGLVFLRLLRRGRETPVDSGESAVDLGALRLQRARALEVRARVRTAPELQQREAEVVVREAFDRIGGGRAPKGTPRALP